MTITQHRKTANNSHLAKTAEEMLTRYKSVSQIERRAIIAQIDSFLSVLKDDEKTFWLKFRAKLVNIDEPKFSTGRVIVSPHAQLALMRTKEEPIEFLQRHQSGDWGEADERQAAVNEVGLKAAGNLISVFKTALNREIWVITEGDRSRTHILVPEEY